MFDGHHIGETVERPWGTYIVTDMGSGFLVKKITVKPGCRTSLQSHDLRSEHWIVVTGEAIVTAPSAPFIRSPPLTVGQSIDIPRNGPHRLSNEGASNLVVIEVQLGDVLREDDIVRYADDFGRPLAP